MNDKIYESICTIFKFDQESKKITFENNISLEPFQDFMIYKTFLFQFCFLLKKGTADFKNMNDIWFFKTFGIEEKEIALDIIKILINKIENKKVENEIYLHSVVKLVNLNNFEKYRVFKYLQSIFSYYNKNFEYLLFPLIYTLGFNNQFIKSILKNDLMDIINPLLEKIDVQESINYYNINEDFLSVFNKLLYCIKLNEKSPKVKKDISPLLQYLCYSGKVSLKTKDLDEEYPESFNYFSEIKALLIEYDNKFEKEKEKLIAAQSDDSKYDTLEEKYNDQNNNKGNNENSTISSSDKDQNGNNSKINLTTSEQSPKINNHQQNKPNITASVEIKELIQLEIESYFSYFGGCNKLNNLCAKIPTIIKEMNINKNSLDKYYKLLFENSKNIILIKKLSSTILLLQNSNIFNIKRKLVEAMIFNIIEKYKTYFSFNSEYYPKESNLNQLMKYILEKLITCKQDNNTDLIKEDLTRLESIIKNVNNNMNSNSSLVIDNKEKTGKKIKMVIDFLRFCKNYLHPFVHANDKGINYYLLPRSLFSSNLKYADYVFSLTDIINGNNNDEKEEKNEINLETIDNDLKLYKDEKVIEIDEALKILFQNKTSYLDAINIDNIISSQKNYQDELKLLDKNIGPFFEIFPVELYQDFIITDEINQKEADLITKLNNFDISISQIIDNKLARDEGYKIIQDIKKLIDFETKEVETFYSNFRGSNLQIKFESLNSKTNRIYLILQFLKKQSETINNARKNIYEQYEKNLNILITEANQYRYFLKQSLSINVNLFDEWAIDAKSRYNDKYLKMDILLNDFKELLTSVKLDINYSYDEKFVLWTVKNNFSDYLK